MDKILIAAVAENGVIGRDGDIPWHYPEDLEHFRETTMGSPVVMGSGTYRSLPAEARPLDGRKNIVLTRSGIDAPESVEQANSLDEAWRIARKTGSGRAFVIGGASVYEQALPEADRMIITEVHDEPEGDTFFPDWNGSNWKEVEREDHGEFSFVTYERQALSNE
ncbi:MAG: dihydrofolate reductase [Candidatus Nanohaloarchaea archaeon]